jgi:hypothetical protein
LYRNNKQQTSDNRHQTTDNRQHTTDNRQKTTDNMSGTENEDTAAAITSHSAGMIGMIASALASLSAEDDTVVQANCCLEDADIEAIGSHKDEETTSAAVNKNKNGANTKATAQEIITNKLLAGYTLNGEVCDKCMMPTMAMNGVASCVICTSEFTARYVID